MLKELIEKRGKLSAQIAEMRQALDGKVASAEERSAWDKLLADYTANEASIEAEQRRSESEKVLAKRAVESTDKAQRETRESEIFRDILLRGKMAVSALS